MLCIESGLPTSMGATAELVDFLRPEPLGFTLPRLTVALIPNANSRKPSCRISIAALERFCCLRFKFLVCFFKYSEQLDNPFVSGVNLHLVMGF
jgi:hypothetical protein